MNAGHLLIDDDPEGLSCVVTVTKEISLKQSCSPKVTNPDVVALCYLLSIDFWCEGQYAAQRGRIKTEAWWVGGFTNHRSFYFEALCWLSSGKHHSLERKDNILRILSPAKKTFPSTAQNPEKTHVQPYYLLWKQPDSAVQGVVEDWGHK